MIAIKLVAVFAMACLCAEGMKTVNKYSNQENYESFLASIDQQREADLVREKDFVYVPTQRDHRYNADRNGEEYVKCMEFNSTDLESAQNVRCPRTSAEFDPICILTINFSKKTFQGGCMNSPVIDQTTCQSECVMRTKHYSYYMNPNKQALIGTCCCKSNMCNADFMNIWQKERRALNLDENDEERKENHHHHHHHHMEEESPKSAATFASFLGGIF